MTIRSAERAQLRSSCASAEVDESKGMSWTEVERVFRYVVWALSPPGVVSKSFSILESMQSASSASLGQDRTAPMMSIRVINLVPDGVLHQLGRRLSCLAIGLGEGVGTAPE
jgi:hypothetical protein